ncbi:MAG: glycosyltransferase [Ferruginibacter sp.]
MNSNQALFICNEKFLNSNSNEGGVKFCTNEYITLLSTKFNLLYLPVTYSKSFFYKLSKKLAISSYNDYDVNSFKETIVKIINENKIQFIFLNLTNTTVFAKLIKDIDNNVKVILCSHGNESGDYLHELVKHQKYNGIKKIFATFSLGKMLEMEATLRTEIDLVLTVSDVEVGIEKWLGATKVFMVPRYIDKMQIPYNPVLGKVGFFSDLSHEPNYYGILQVCECLQKNNCSNIQLQLAGAGKERGENLEQRFKFVKYLGYLSNENLLAEFSTWTFALNPVFYYSRGVSTKLGKSLSYGMPVITSEIGLRGYLWKEGNIPTCSGAEEMANLISDLAYNIDACKKYKEEVIKIQNTAPTYTDIMDKVHSFLQ